MSYIYIIILDLDPDFSILMRSFIMRDNTNKIQTAPLNMFDEKVQFL